MPFSRRGLGTLDEWNGIYTNAFPVSGPLEAGASSYIFNVV
jgi:hypothetical protein